MSNEKSYEEQLGELNQVLRNLESDSISIDDLSSKLSEAFGLVDSLKSHLLGIETKVSAVISVRNSQENQAHEKA